MKRSIVMALVLCLAVFVITGCNKKRSGPSVAVVDAEKVFQDSKLAQKGMVHLDSLSSKFSVRLAEMQAALAVDSENEEMTKKFQAELMSLQADFETRQMDAANKLNKLFDEVVEEYRAKNNIELIVPVQVVVAKGSETDITGEIIKLLDSRDLDFGPDEVAPMKGKIPPDAAAPMVENPAQAPAGAASAEPGTK